MSEPKIVRRCPNCDETVLIPLADRAMLDFFVCEKCGFKGEPAERREKPRAPGSFSEGED